MLNQNIQVKELLDLLKRDGNDWLLLHRETLINQEEREMKLESRIYCSDCTQSTIRTGVYQKLYYHANSLTKISRCKALTSEEKVAYTCPHCGKTSGLHRSLEFFTEIKNPEKRYHVAGMSCLSDLNEEGLHLLTEVSHLLPNKVHLPSLSLEMKSLGYQLLRGRLAFIHNPETLEIVEAMKNMDCAYFYLGQGLDLAFESEDHQWVKLPKNRAFSDRCGTKDGATEYITVSVQDGSTLLNQTGLRNLLEELKTRSNFLTFDQLKEVYSYERFRQAYPCIEQLAKCGYVKLIIDLMRADKRKFYCEFSADFLLEPHATNPSRAFGYPKAVLKQLKMRGWLGGLRSAMMMKELHRLSPIDLAFVNEIDEIFDHNTLSRTKHLLEDLYLLGYSYVETMKYAKRAYLNQAIPVVESLTLLRDYVNMAAQMDTTYERFPRSLKLTHDLMVRNHKFRQDEKLNEQFKAQVKKHEHLCYAPANEKFFITLPSDSKELVKEGHELSHCVASYVNMVSKGETMILFLRQADQPDQPYITIEWRDQRVVQVRGFANAPLENFPEAQAFFVKWKAYAESFTKKQSA